jgi:Protein of unknown function (DUF1573)
VSRPDSTYPVIIDDYKLDMSQFSQRVMDKKKFKITNVSDKPLKLTLVSTHPDFFEVKVPKEIKPGQVGEGVLTLTEKAIGQSFEKSFTFELNDEKTTRFTVPVKRTMQMANKPADSANKPVQPH